MHLSSGSYAARKEEDEEKGGHGGQAQRGSEWGRRREISLNRWEGERGEGRAKGGYGGGELWGY